MTSPRRTPTEGQDTDVDGDVYADVVDNRVQRLFKGILYPILTVGGHANAITGTVDPVLDDYANGQFYEFQPIAANAAGGVIINIDAKGDIRILTAEGAELSEGALSPTRKYLLYCDGSDMFVMTAAGSGSGEIDQLPGQGNIASTVSADKRRLFGIDPDGRLAVLRQGEYSTLPGLGLIRPTLANRLLLPSEGMAPLTLRDMDIGFCHTLDRWGVQQIASIDEYGLTQQTAGPEDKTITGRHGRNGVIFARTMPLDQERIYENPQGVARATVKSGHPTEDSLLYESSVVRMGVQLGESLSYGQLVSGNPFAIHVRPPYPGGVLCFDLGVVPEREVSNPSSSDYGGFIDCRETVSVFNPTQAETPVTALGLMLYDTYDRESPIVMWGGGKGGTTLANMDKGTQPYTNMMEAIEAFVSHSLLEWSDCIPIVECLHLIMGANDSVTLDATFRPVLDQFVTDFQTDVEAITNQVAAGQHAPYIILGQTRRNLGPLTPYSSDRATRSMFEYWEDNPTCLMRPPPYLALHDDDITHMRPWGYHSLGVDAGMAHRFWVRHGETRPMPRILSATRSDDYLVTFWDVTLGPLALDPQIRYDNTLGISWEDGGISADSATVVEAWIVDAKAGRVDIRLSNTPTNTLKRIVVAGMSEAINVTPSRKAGLRTPICIPTNEVDPVTGRVWMARPPSQYFSVG